MARLLTLLLTTLTYPCGVAGDVSEVKLAGAVVGTFLGTLMLCAVAAVLGWRYYVRPRRHDTKDKKQRTQDGNSFTSTTADAAMRPPKPPRLTVTSERQTSHNATDSSTPDTLPVTVSLLCNEPDVGLGFDISGDQTGAVYVREVFNHGPAAQTGKIQPGDRLLSLTVSTVCMELEDALTIFSYSTPYPVQLSLVPATAAASPGPQTPHGRRSWSLDQLDARRRQRRHGEAVRLRPARTGDSDGRRSSFDVTHLRATDHTPVERNTGNPAHGADGPRSTTDHTSDPGYQLRPAVRDNPTKSSSTDADDERNSIKEMSCTGVITSTDQTTFVTQQLPTVTVEDKSLLHSENIIADSLTTSSSNVANTAIAVSLDDGDDHSADDRELCLCEEAPDSCNACLNRTTDGQRNGDEIASSSLNHHHHRHHHHHQQQQQQQHLKPSYNASDSDSGALDEQSSVSLVGHGFVKLANDLDCEVFDDLELDDDDSFSITTDRPANKKKRSLIGSIESLLKSSSEESNRENKKSSEVVGEDVDYVDEYVTQSRSTPVTYVAEQQNQDNWKSVDHDRDSLSEINTRDQSKFAECLASESNELLSMWFDEVLGAAGISEAFAVSCSNSLQHGNLVQSKLEETQSGITASESVCGQSDVEDLHDAMNSSSARFDEPDDSTKFQEKTGANDSTKEYDVDQSKDTEKGMLVDTKDNVERMITEVHEKLQVIEELSGAVTADCEDLTAAKHRSTVCFNELEANINPPALPLSHTDKGNTITHNIDNHIKPKEEATITNSDLNATSASDNGLNMMCDNCDVLVAEADVGGAALKCGTGSDTLAQQEMVDAGLHGEKFNSFCQVRGAKGEKYGMMTSAAESRDQSIELDTQELDHLRHSVVIQVSEPDKSADTFDTNDTVPSMLSARPLVVKDKRSSEVGGNNLRHSVVIEVTDETATSTHPQDIKDKRSSQADLSDASEAPSVLTMLLNLFSDEDEAKRLAIPIDDQTSSGHCLVAMETSTATSGGTKLAPVNSTSIRSRTSMAETDKEDIRTNNRYETAAADSVFDGPDNYWFGGESLEQNQCLSASNHSHVHNYCKETSDSQDVTHADDSSAKHSFTRSNAKDFNVTQSRTKLNVEEVEETSESTVVMHPVPDLPDKCLYVERSEEILISPIVSISFDSNPSLVMGENDSSLSGFVHSERLNVTSKDMLMTITNHDPVQTAVMGNVEESRNRICTNQTVQRTHVVGVPNQLPINSSEDKSSTSAQLLRQNAAVRPPSSDLTSVIHRQVQVKRNLSTGSTVKTGNSNAGNVSEKPAFVVPTVCHRSMPDHNNNNSGRSSISQTVSDGQKSDITKSTVTTPPYNEIDSSMYSWQQELDSAAVDHAVSRGRRSVSNGREVRYNDTIVPRVGIHRPPFQTSGANPTVDCLNGETGSCRVYNHLTGSVPDLTSTSPGMDDSFLSESRHDVTQSSDPRDDNDVTKLRLRPIDARCVGDQIGSARSVGDVSEGQRVSRLTVQLGCGTAGSSPQRTDNRRRPRRRRIVCLPHSSLASSTTNDDMSSIHFHRTPYHLPQQT